MRTALIIVDMVKDFTKPGGAVYYPQNQAVIPAILRVRQACRDKNVLTVFLKQTLRAGKEDPAFAGMRLNCVEGSGGEELDDAFEVNPEDYVIQKRRYSGFYGTDLDLVLRENGIETVVLVGTKTNCCVRATAEDAFYRNYRVVVLSDCVATNSDEVQAVHLEDIRKYLGEVMDSHAFLLRLGKEEY